MAKKDKTVKLAATTTGKSYTYLTLNGNDDALQTTLKTAMKETHEYEGTLYVTHNAGAPKNPPPCLPGMPGYPNCH